jgi:hypothetical protein
VTIPANYHMRMGAVARLKSMFDVSTWLDIAVTEMSHPLKFRDERRYTDRLKDARVKTGLEPRHPRHHREAQIAAAAPRHRLCSGDRAGDRKCPRQARAQGRIVANDVSPATGIMGGDRDTVHLVTGDGVESWPDQAKDDVAARLVARIAAALAAS